MIPLTDLVCTKETAEKMKALGFPQDCHFAYYQSGKYYCMEQEIPASEARVEPNIGKEVSFPHIYLFAAPTAAEIELPSTAFLPRLKIEKLEDEYYVGFNFLGDQPISIHTNLAEAMALMWIYLKEKGLITGDTDSNVRSHSNM